MPRTLEIRMAAAGDALDRFEAAWNRVQEGVPMRTLHVLSLRDLPLLLKTLTPARWRLLEALRAEGPLSIYDLARRIGRDYKNVHTDVTQLAFLGVIERGDGGRVRVPWDVLRAELDFEG